MSDLEKLEYIHSTLQDMGHIFGVEDDMLTRSIKHVEELYEQEKINERTNERTEHRNRR